MMRRELRSAYDWGVIYAALVSRGGSCNHLTNLHAGASRLAPEEPPVDLFGQPTELNGILAFTTDGGDSPNHIPSSLLPPTVKSAVADFYGRHSYGFSL